MFEHEVASRKPRGLLVLIVDDHADSRELYELGLAQCGFETCGSNTAREAFELICARRPDAIVTDLAMPEIDGFFLIHQLKEDARTRDIPIVAVSGHASAQTRSEVLAAGAHAFLPKPCSVPELVDALRGILSAAGRPGPGN